MIRIPLDIKYSFPRLYRIGTVTETGEDEEKMPIAKFLSTFFAFITTTLHLQYRHPQINSDSPLV